MAKIRKIHAREILDSRGFPTIEVEVTVNSVADSMQEELSSSRDTFTGRAMVPSGASTGEGEALELRDGNPKRYLGKGVLNAVRNVHEKIAPALVEREFTLPSHLDDALRDLDGTPNKGKLGANAILGISMAYVKAVALAKGIPTDQYLANIYGATGTLLPVPMMNILNGGKHADNGLAIQEFMIVPAGFDKFSESLRAGVEVFHRLKKILHDRGLSTGVGDEGGFAPAIDDDKPHEQALTFILQAISDAGYKPGKDIFLALDCAASEFSDGKGTYQFEGKRLSSEEMVAFYADWAQRFPIISIEDGLSEHDWAGWQLLTEKLGNQCQLVGDDLFVTNPVYLKTGIEKRVANSILIKLNQIGTVTETLETMKMAAQAGYNRVTSHRSGETEDSFIADLAVATDCGQIKTGSASRSDRLAKYNQLLRLEERLGERARFGGIRSFYRAGKFN